MINYVNSTVDKKISWKNASSCTSDSREALENRQNRLHEVSMRLSARNTKSVRQVGIEVCDIPTTYDRFINLESFLTEFEEKVIETHRLSALDFALKSTPCRWWVTHKQSILEWPQCRILMEVRFG